MSTRTPSPLSSASTLPSAPGSPPHKSMTLLLDGTDRGPKSFESAAVKLEEIAAAASSTLFVYDLAEQVGFGTSSKSRATSAVHLQTRDGAGLFLAGRLSQGSSKDAEQGAVITAYTTLPGLAAMGQALAYLPRPTPSSRLVLQIPNVTATTDALALMPSLASLSTILPILPASCAVLLSATPQETVDFGALSYGVSDLHVIHVFDHHSSARETGHILTHNPVKGNVTLQDGLRAAGYDLFSYTGDRDAQDVVVLLNGPLALAAKTLAANAKDFGVVVVRVLRPWDEAALQAVLPPNVRRIHVIDEVHDATNQGPLFLDVFSTTVDPSTVGPSVKAHRVTPVQSRNFINDPWTFTTFLRDIFPAAPAPTTAFHVPNGKNVLFFTTPGSVLSAAPYIILSTFMSHKAIDARLLETHDAFSRSEGVTAERLLLYPKGAVGEHVPIPFVLPLSGDSADFLAILDPTLLKSHALLDKARHGSPVLISGPWSAAELATSLPAEVTSLVRDRSLQLCLLNSRSLAEKVAGADATVLAAIENLVIHLAFLRLYLGKAATQATVLKVALGTYGENAGKLKLDELNAMVWDALVEVELPVPEDDDAKSSALKEFQFTAVVPAAGDDEGEYGAARLGSWRDAAKHLLFQPSYTPESLIPSNLSSYDQHPALRPELPERTFLVTCTVNRRLTPLDYDRNVFHLEFDTKGTGLKYEIGEALGVHGWNDVDEVLDFCKWYGADPSRVITLPVPGTDGERMHTRTVFQALQQQIDLFGKPPKSFYTDLAEHATNAVDKYALFFIGSAEGSSTFKMLSEKETVTFADVLARWPSARPSIEKLCELVGDIKPRHYSIASAQSVVGDQVDLLVVTVDWLTPSGSPRYGQCTRYLAGLRVGQKVTVSIKPSVMKLPPDNMQPLILAGLGTGAAPFRAFLQHRAWQASQNIPVGPVYYYFGARHQSQEYLYGEEIEAFLLDSTITKAGLAFSRDGPRKVYIQHKMLEDAEVLAGMLREQSGVFYLCGPTWPVADIYEALVDALVKFKGLDRESAGTYLEDLKEEERYVLEVY